MELVPASHQSAAPEPAVRGNGNPTPAVGARGGMVFSALCLAAYVAAIVAAAVS